MIPSDSAGIPARYIATALYNITAIKTGDLWSSSGAPSPYMVNHETHKPHKTHKTQPNASAAAIAAGMVLQS